MRLRELGSRDRRVDGLIRRAGVAVLTNSFNGPKVYEEVVPAAVGGVHPSLAWVQKL